ncbi:MAG: serine/threonine protein kinase [Bacteroidales bacterium]|nr:serine/threonine protein kinase [Bacteroidales bacterium]
MKTLKSEVANDPMYQGMLDKEFNLMMQLNHPNVVRVYSREEIPNFGPCIVMEYIDGRTLGDFLSEKPTQSVRESVVRQLLEAIGYCHGKQIIHRDLKPSNVLVTYNGNRVKLIDFGLSDSDSYAVLKEPAYTKAYAAPEQLSGGKVDNRTDLYAFGLILKQLFPNQCGVIFRKCLQPKKEKRYASAEEVMMAMRRIMQLRKSFPLWCVLFLTITAISVISAMNWRQHNRQMRSTTEQTTASSDTISPENPSPYDDSKTISIQSPTRHSEKY